MISAYTAHETFVMQDMWWTACPGVPVRQDAVNSFAKFYFETPQPMPVPIECALKRGDKPWEMHGRVKRISSEEPIHALIQAVH